MKYRILGKESPLEMSAIGFGCMGMSHASGTPLPEADAKKLLAKAIDIGVTHFDTAEVYGPFENEELVGHCLKGLRDKVVLASKFGVRLSEVTHGTPIPDARPEIIRKSLEGSLKRLQTDHLDLYYQHRPDPNVPVEDVAGVMADLIREGKILHWGGSEFSPELIRRAHKVCPLTVVENRYHMMFRKYEQTVFPVCEELGIGYVAFSPMANGFLTAAYDKDSKFEPGLDYRAKMPQFQPENYDKNHDLLNLLRTMAAKKNATPAQISLAWILAMKPWIVPIPGTRKESRLIENSGAADIDITPAELAEINGKLDTIEMSDVFTGTGSKK